MELKTLADNEPKIYLTFLNSFVSEKWDDEKVQKKLAQLMNAMNASQEEDVKISFSDFALDFYLHFEEHKININSFMTQRLLPEARNFIQYQADNWYKANNNIK